jgi:hypothetical protein
VQQNPAQPSVARIVASSVSLLKLNLPVEHSFSICRSQLARVVPFDLEFHQGHHDVGGSMLRADLGPQGEWIFMHSLTESSVDGSPVKRLHFAYTLSPAFSWERKLLVP